MPNQLANESSPYLLQHQDNPVDWYPWGPEALQRAKDEDKPIFLSIGYSACHWCHVMEHESFEDERIAAIVNEHFVAIKVDREERPDIDQIYMNAVQMMTGRGGWPMTVFLTPELEPFYAGTYFPPTRRQGMPGFDEILAAVNDAWENRRDQLQEQAEKITAELQTLGQGGDQGELSRELTEGAVNQLARAFDPDWGGFGAAPKFPHTMDLQLLLRHWFRTGNERSLQMVRTTLDRMAAGGIYDHLGGGFARYSVDQRWLVPHFEKMLYDNALLALIYLEAHQVTDQLGYAQVVRETLGYVLRDMTDPAGGFYSSEDADSEGEEGKFYVWTPAELQEVLGPEAAETFARVYDVTESGNFEGNNILNLPKSIAQAARMLGRDEADLSRELAASRQKLLAVREQRVHPGKDDKVLVSWNALMIDAMARAGVVLGEPRYGDAAAKAADFILTEMRRPDGRLLHTWRGGEAKLDAYLDDYAYFAGALITLYETTFDSKWIEAAGEMVDALQQHFYDEQAGGFFFTADDHEQLIARQKDTTDASVPSGNAAAAMALLRLGKLSGDAAMLKSADETMQLGVDLMRRAPTAMGQMLLAVDFRLGPTYELVFCGDAGELLTDLQRQFLPNKVLAAAVSQEATPASLADLFAGKQTESQQPRLYVCEGFTCQAPAEGALAISAAVAQMTRQPEAD